MSHPNSHTDFNIFDKIAQVHFNDRFFQHESKKVFNLLRDSSKALQEEEERNGSLETSRDECPICLSDIYKQNECILPCKHCLHVHCVLQLSESDLNTCCPLCRKDIPSMKLNLIPLKSNDKELNKARCKLRINIKLWTGIQAALVERHEQNENLKSNMSRENHAHMRGLFALIDMYFVPRRNHTFYPMSFREFYELDIDAMEAVAREEWNNTLKTIVTELISKHWHLIEDLSEFPEDERNKMPSGRERHARLKMVSETVGSLIDKRLFRRLHTTPRCTMS